MKPLQPVKIMENSQINLRVILGHDLIIPSSREVIIGCHTADTPEEARRQIAETWGCSIERTVVVTYAEYERYLNGPLNEEQGPVQTRYECNWCHAVSYVPSFLSREDKRYPIKDAHGELVGQAVFGPCRHRDCRDRQKAFDEMMAGGLQVLDKAGEPKTREGVGGSDA